MAKYEYELIEQKKAQELKIAYIIAIVLPIIMLIAGVLWGISQLNTDPDYVTKKVSEQDLCTFCFNESILPKQDTIGAVQANAPEFKVDIKQKYVLEKCISTSETSFVLNFELMPKVSINEILLYTPDSFDITRIINLDTNKSVEYTLEKTPGAKTVHMLIKDDLDKVNLKVTGIFNKAGDYNLLPVFKFVNEQKQAMPAVPVHVVDSCNKPSATPVATATPTPTSVQQDQTTNNSSDNSTSSSTTDNTTTDDSTITSTVPETGLISDIFYLTVGIIIGLVILSVRKVNLPYDSINNVFKAVYTTAGDIFARTLGNKQYTEKKILDKVVKTSKSKKSSP